VFAPSLLHRSGDDLRLRYEPKNAAVNSVPQIFCSPPATSLTFLLDAISNVSYTKSLAS
jgi:hypothetical protein